MSPLVRHRRAIGTALVIIALIALMSVTARERERITVLEQYLIELIAPAQRGVTQIAGRVLESIHMVRQWRSVYEELEQLRAELDRYRGLETAFTETFSENSRLSRLLGLAEQMPVDVTAARVIGRNPDNWFSTVSIDRGTMHGVKRDMVAVTDRGVVGRVIRVTPRTAMVLLVTDPDSGIGALVMRSRDAGVVLGRVGDSTFVSMRFFAREADVEIGDLIMTSGVSSVFPRGLVIGRVEQVTGGQALMTEALIRPAVDLRRVEELMIILAVGAGLDLESGADDGPTDPEAPVEGDR